MIGQYTEQEFFEKYDRAEHRSGSLAEGQVSLQFGATVNKYRRETDGSWTNYDCRTISERLRR